MIMAGNKLSLDDYSMIILRLSVETVDTTMSSCSAKCFDEEWDQGNTLHAESSARV